MDNRKLVAIVVNADTGEIMGCIYDDPLRDIRKSNPYPCEADI